MKYEWLVIVTHHVRYYDTLTMVIIIIIIVMKDWYESVRSEF